MSMTVSYNEYPEIVDKEVVSTRVDKDGNVYLGDKEGFEFTLSKELVDKIKAT